MRSVFRPLFYLFLLLGCIARLDSLESTDSKSATILCTVFPVYALAKDLTTGTSLKIELLLPPNLGCPHHYSLTPGDMEKVTRAKILAINGLGFEPFSEILIREFPDKEILDCASGAPLLLTDPETKAPNPHLFTCSRGLRTMMDNLRIGLEKTFPEEKQRVGSNASELLAEIQKAEEEAIAAARDLASLPVLLTHTSLDYLARDLHLEVIAHTNYDQDEGREPSAGELLRLTAFLQQAKPRGILTDDQSKDPVAELLFRETGTKLVPCNTLTTGTLDIPRFYSIQVLRENIRRLVKETGAQAPASKK